MLPSVSLHCPYCGEPIELLLDASAGIQRYVEDCPVCCRPMVVSTADAGDGEVAATARAEDDV